MDVLAPEKSIKLRNSANQMRVLIVPNFCDSIRNGDKHRNRGVVPLKIWVFPLSFNTSPCKYENKKTS